MSVCLVVGAGGSLAQAQRFRPHREKSHPPLDLTFFERIRSLDIPIGEELKRLATQIGGLTPFERAPPTVRMEEFFRDVHYEFLRVGTLDADVKEAYHQLVDVYQAVLAETTNWLSEGHAAGPLSVLLGGATSGGHALDILTFNHDLMVENEIEKRAALRRQWCVRLGYGAVGEGAEVRRGPEGTHFGLHPPGCTHPHPVRLFKLHGSLSWFLRTRDQRPAASFMTGSIQPGDIVVVTRRAILPRGNYIYTGRPGRGRTRWYLNPMIIPPIANKQALISASLSAVWSEAEEALKSATRIVVFGYSLPLADLDAEKMFQRAFAQNTTSEFIDVVNPDPTSTGRYGGLTRQTPVRWFPDVESLLEVAPFA